MWVRNGYTKQGQNREMLVCSLHWILLTASLTILPMFLDSCRLVSPHSLGWGTTRSTEGLRFSTGPTPRRMSDLGCAVNYCYSTWRLQVEETEHRATWEGMTRAELKDGWLELQESRAAVPVIRLQVYLADELDVGCEMSAGWWASGDVTEWNTDLTRGASFRRKAGLCFGTWQIGAV